MGFIFDGLDTESYDREYSDRDLLRRIVSYFRPFGRKMALAALMRIPSFRRCVLVTNKLGSPWTLPPLPEIGG